jgi:hypothetical protein
MMSYQRQFIVTALLMRKKNKIKKSGSTLYSHVAFGS